MYVNAQAVLRLLVDIKRIWDREGFGTNPRESDPLYERLKQAIAELSDEEC
jgi:hypothetical protein